METNPQPRGLVSELDNRFAQIYGEFADQVTRDMIAASGWLSVCLLNQCTRIPGHTASVCLFTL